MQIDGLLAFWTKSNVMKIKRNIPGFVFNTLVLFVSCYLLGLNGVFVSFLVTPLDAIVTKYIVDWKMTLVQSIYARLTNTKNEKRKTPEETGGMPIKTMENLYARVRENCKKAIASIDESALEWIRDMNWSHGKEGDTRTYTGQLEDVIAAVTKCNMRDKYIVLGRAGAGKTSVLERYIFHLLGETFTGGAIPVYFSLSSWNKEQILDQWLERGLVTDYKVEKNKVSILISHGFVIPILDGLDQVHIDLRQNVLQQIYDYASRGNKIVLSSRPEEFEAEKANVSDLDEYFCVLRLKRLSPTQALDAIKDPAAREHTARIASISESLQRFSCYPMALNIIALIAKDLNAHDIADISQSEGPIEIYNKLWARYDIYIFNEERNRKPSVNLRLKNLLPAIMECVKKFSFDDLRHIFRTPYTEAQIKTWLLRISGMLETNFFIENLQPGFLAPADRTFYFVISRTLCAMALSLSLGFFLASPFEYLASGIVIGYCMVLLLKSRKWIREKWYSRWPKWLPYIVNPAIFVFVTLVTLVLYFGFLGIRKDADMTLNKSFAITDANLGLFMCFFIGTAFGIRDLFQSERRDIRLVARAPKNARQLLVFGAFGSFVLGLTLAVSAVLMQRYFSYSTLGDWAQAYQGTDLIMLAWLAGVVFGFPLFGILGWLNQSDTELSESDRTEAGLSPDHSIQSSLRNSVRTGLLVSIIVIPLFGLFFAILTNWEVTSVYKGVIAGLGGTSLAMLWFGGFDLIQHWTLRFIIWVKGYGPWDFIHFLENAKRLRFARRMGAGYSFMHPTLVKYFSPEHHTAVTAPRPARILGLFIPALLIIELYIVAMPVYHRYWPGYFWKSAYVLKWERCNLVKQINDSTFVIQSTQYEKDTLELTASGRIKVGEFTGYITPSGTEAAFLGFAISNVYDFDTAKTKDFCHGALLVKKMNGHTQWYGFPREYIYPVHLLSSTRKLRITVSKGDTLRFIVNDNEWHNNTGAFAIRIRRAPKEYPKIVAHRGGAALAPENTLEAIRKSSALNVDFVEIDIHQTRDGQLVVMHDKDVSRTTDGEGNIADLNWAEIQSFKVDGADNIHVPRLNEVLDLVKPTRTRILIEVKNPSVYPDISTTLVNLLKEKDMTGRVIIFSFDKDYIEKLEDDYGELLSTGIFAWTPWFLGDMTNVDCVGLNYTSVVLMDKDKINAKIGKRKLFVWTVEAPGLMQKFIDMDNVHGIITDHPDELKRILAQ